MKIILQHLQFIQSAAAETCSQLYTKEINSVQTFCLTLLERLQHSAGSLILLFNAMNDDRSHEFSAGIITRSQILDTLIGMNLLLVVKKAEADGVDAPERESRILEFRNIMLADGLSQTIFYLKKAKDLGLITEDNLKTNFTNFVHTYKPFFNEYAIEGAEPTMKYPKAAGPTDLFKNLANHPELKNIASLYDAYLYFSKYDHFGIMSSQIIREPWGTKMKIYLDAYEALVAALSFLHVILAGQEPADEFIKQRLTATNQYPLEQVIKPHIPGQK